MNVHQDEARHWEIKILIIGTEEDADRLVDEATEELKGFQFATYKPLEEE